MRIICALGLLASLSLVGPSGLAANDAQAQLTPSDVMERLRQDERIAEENIDVVVRKDGTVLLLGRVESQDAKWRARRAAEAVAGVDKVVDRLRIAPATENWRLALREDVTQRLAEDGPNILGRWLRVTQKGSVHIGGAVDHPAKVRWAGQLVKEVPGVTEVVNRIKVADVAPPEEPRADRAIREEVNAVLGRAPSLDESLITVTVHGKVVHLTGVVADPAQKRKAVKIAKVPGAEQVDATGLRVTGWLERQSGDRDMAR